MTLTKTQNEELDALKSKILRIEKNMSNAQTEIEIAQDIEDFKTVKRLEAAIEFGYESIQSMVKMQAQSMKLSTHIVFDLIFDREATLEFLNK